MPQDDTGNPKGLNEYWDDKRIWSCSGAAPEPPCQVHNVSGILHLAGVLDDGVVGGPVTPSAAWLRHNEGSKGAQFGVCMLSIPEGPGTQYLRTLVPKTIP